MTTVSGVRRRHRNDEFNGVWDPKDVEDLRFIFRNNSNDIVAGALNRSEGSVRNKASRLGLTKTQKYMRTLFA